MVDIATDEQPRERLLTFAALQAKFDRPRSRSSIYRDVQDGFLPKPLDWNGRPHWRESEVDAAMAAPEPIQDYAENAA